MINLLIYPACVALLVWQVRKWKRAPELSDRRARDELRFAARMLAYGVPGVIAVGFLVGAFDSHAGAFIIQHGINILLILCAFAVAELYCRWNREGL